jgi:vacuolar-type H+-ATPase subunit E/Vma4
MAIDLNSILLEILNVTDEMLEGQIETLFGKLNDKLDEMAGDPETKFTAKGKQVVLLGLRDKLIKILPLEDFPLD